MEPPPVSKQSRRIRTTGVNARSNWVIPRSVTTFASLSPGPGTALTFWCAVLATVNRKQMHAHTIVIDAFVLLRHPLAPRPLCPAPNAREVTVSYEANGPGTLLVLPGCRMPWRCRTSSSGGG